MNKKLLTFILESLHPRLARLEKKGGGLWEVPRDWLPKSAREGDVITLSIFVDKEKTREEKNTIKKLQEELMERK